MRKNINRIRIILTDILGVLLMIAALLLGWLPGPGGIPLFLVGLGLLAINHESARNLLEDFDKKRRYYTDKFLVGGSKTRWTFDGISLVLFVGGLALILESHHAIFRGFGLGIICTSLILVLSNQKRFDRFMSNRKKKN